jgi:hypothetical protein
VGRRRRSPRPESAAPRLARSGGRSYRTAGRVASVPGHPCPRWKGSPFLSESLPYLDKGVRRRGAASPSCAVARPAELDHSFVCQDHHRTVDGGDADAQTSGDRPICLERTPWGKAIRLCQELLTEALGNSLRLVRRTGRGALTARVHTYPPVDRPSRTGRRRIDFNEAQPPSAHLLTRGAEAPREPAATHRDDHIRVCTASRSTDLQDGPTARTDYVQCRGQLSG